VTFFFVSFVSLSPTKMQRWRRFLSAICIFLLLGACASADVVRCFSGQFAPTNVNVDTTDFYYTIDVLTPLPLEIRLDYLEFGPVQVNACTWASGVDALELYMNEALAAYWPMHCSDREYLQLAVGSLGGTLWGSEPLTPKASGRTLAMQYGRIDFASGTWTSTQQPSRLRTVRLRLFSGGKRRFMPTFPLITPPLVVHVCLAAEAVPGDFAQTTPYVEVGAPAHTVFPLASCVYEERGRCGANLGFCNTDPQRSVALTPYTSHDNTLSPGNMEAGWHLPKEYPPGCRRSDVRPQLHIGWDCEMTEPKWHLNGSVLRLTALTPRCASSPFDGKTDAQILASLGVDMDGVAKIDRPLHTEQSFKVNIETARQVWRENGVAVPVLRDRLTKK
jgi:hypothetical protein